MLYIIPAVYLCSGPHPLLMATTAPGAPPLHRCMSDFYTKKTRLKIRPKFEYGFNFQISEQSMYKHCLTMGQQDHITGFPYRVCFRTRVGIKKVGKLKRSSQSDLDKKTARITAVVA